MKVFPLILTALLLTAELATQEDPKPTPMNHWITLGADYTCVHLDADAESSYSGNLSGLQGFYEYAPDNDFFGGIRLKYRQGSCRTADGKRGLLDLNGAEYIGYSWAWTDWFCAAFTGFGFRYLGHNVKPSSLQLGYYEFYIPVGLIVEYTFTSYFTLALYATWMPQAFPTVNIQSLEKTFFSLNRTYGNAAIELPFVFTLNKIGSWNLSISPFYERWQNGRTSAGISPALQGNTYNFYGVDLNLIYGF